MARIGFDKGAFFSFLFLVVFVGLIFGSVLAVTRFSQIRSKASTPNKPSTIELVNVTESAATLFWLTEEPTIGYVTFGEILDLGKSRLDDRDIVGGDQLKYRSHLVSLTKLKPKTKYFYTLGVDSETFDRKGYPFIFFTSSQPTSTIKEQMLTGKVYVRGRIPAENYFVTVAFERENGELSNTLGTLTEKNGDFTLDLSKLRTADGTNVFSLAPTESVTVDTSIRDEFGEVATQSFIYALKDPFPALFFNNAGKEPGSLQDLPSLLDIQATPRPSLRPAPSSKAADLLLPSAKTPQPTKTPQPAPTAKPSLRLLL